MLSAAIGVAACSSYGAGSAVDVGPNFPSMTLYASNSNQNAISIYNKGQKTGTGPAFEIGGASTTLNGPQYLAFDTSQNLWVTNFNPSTNGALLIEIQALATGDVIPLQSAALVGHLRGIAISAKSKLKGFSPLMVISDVIPTEKYTSQVLLFVPGSTVPYQSIAGPKPALRVPSGVALDANNHIYVANVQGAKVQEFVLPKPTPTPKNTPTPSPTPSPTSTPSGSPSPSPTPSPTPTPINIIARITISGPNTHVVTPTSVTVDSDGNIYVSDEGTLGSLHTASILVFAPPKNKGIVNVKPIRQIRGPNSLLTTPTDVKVDTKAGLIYVADSGEVLVFKIGDNGDPAPQAIYKSPGAITGLGLVP
ncbi:MAG TPA: SBBP repeat-containing protein [Candidatus Tumulicola sp.]